MVVVCEGFYYLFKRLEEFDKLPAFGESIEKNRSSLMNMRDNTKAFHPLGRRLL